MGRSGHAAVLIRLCLPFDRLIANRIRSDQGSSPPARRPMSPRQLWIGGYGPQDSAHGEGLAAFRRIEGAARTSIAVRREAAEELEVGLRSRMEDDGIEFVDLTERERTEFIAASGPATVLAHQGVPEELFDLARS